MSTEIHHPLKYAFGYATGFIFLLGIMIYIYLLINDHLENPTQHSTEETIWIYLFLCILVIGFMISYYSINCLKNDNNNTNTNNTKSNFGGNKMNIRSKPSTGKHNIHSSKFIV